MEKYWEDINNYLKSSQHYSKWLNDDMDYIQEYIEDTFLNVKDYKLENLNKCVRL